MSQEDGNPENLETAGRPRKRGLTSITLGWIAERFRRAERVKEQLKNGTYKVDPEEVAKRLVNHEDER